jgi:hypothetical protein
MKRGYCSAIVAFVCILEGWNLSLAAVRVEHFHTAPANWEGINNRNLNFPLRMVTQDFGYSASGGHISKEQGEIGGIINPAAEPAFYGARLPKRFTMADSFTASGKLLVKSGPGHFLLGFFNSSTINGWRTPNTMVARINPRGNIFHCHIEYCTSQWRAGAGIIGEVLPNKRLAAKELPCDQVYDWELSYRPNAKELSGLLTMKLVNYTASVTVSSEHSSDGATFTHFGILPVMKAWDNPGEAWISNLIIDGKTVDLKSDPGWEGFNNRKTYQTANTRPRFDFGWSPTHFAGGENKGELGGLIFRGDCRDPRRMGAFGDKLALLSLGNKLVARGKVAMMGGVSDSTASIGFYNSEHSLKKNSSQDQSIPMDYLGVNIEGPSSEGFFFYPIYRTHGSIAQTYNYRNGGALRIYPDGKSHDWSLEYDPAGADGRGTIRLSLDAHNCLLQLHPDAKSQGASFDRFGICTPWIDGNSVTAYFDDLEYTCGP